MTANANHTAAATTIDAISGRATNEPTINAEAITADTAKSLIFVFTEASIADRLWRDMLLAFAVLNSRDEH